jgi:hypothetical protein
MFTKADYLNYVDMLADKERAMVFGLQCLLDRVSDEQLAEQLRSLVLEKQETYQEVSGLFCRLFGLSLGEAKLRNLATGEAITCRCLDISLGGMCVESAAELPQNALFALEVRFFESRRPLMRRATVRWCNRTDEGLYKAGFQFEARPATHSGETISDEG